MGLSERRQDGASGNGDDDDEREEKEEELSPPSLFRWIDCNSPPTQPPSLFFPSFHSQTDPSLPVNYEPHDSLRLGLPAYKEEFAAPHPHPVAAVVAAASSSGGDDARRMRALADVYGAGLAARYSIEKQILTR